MIGLVLMIAFIGAQMFGGYVIWVLNDKPKTGLIGEVN